MRNTNEKGSKTPGGERRAAFNISFRKPATFFLIIAAAILFMSVFFKIGNISVEGNSLYTDEEIIEASGIQKGDNLFFINRIAAGSRVIVKLPYVDAVTITRGLPNRVTIIVSESMAVGYVNVNSELWSLSGTGKFLGTLDAAETEYIAAITGITVSEAKVGDIIKPVEGEEEKCAYLIEILDQIQARQLGDRITAIDISDVDAPVLEFDERFTVKLGELGDTEYKFGKFLAAAEQIGENGSGILDVSEGNKVEFSPN